MSLLTITSTNPSLSHVLQKNPNTIREAKKPFEKELRKGRMYGWFEGKDDTTFKLLFLDSDIETSFGNREEFEYLDTSRYSNPYIPIMMITNALTTAANKGHELDKEGFETCLTFTIQCRSGILEKFNSPGLKNFEAAQIAANHFNVTMSAGTIQELLNIAQSLCVLAAFDDKDSYVPLNEAGVTKYLNVLNRAKAGYNLRYLFLSRAIQNRAQFDKLAGLIQQPGMVFKFGNTQVQRFDEVNAFLDTGKRGETLIDIGCGELYSSVKLCGKYDFVLAYDADQEIVDQNVRKVTKRQIENIEPKQAEVNAVWINDNASIFANADVLMCEFLEHTEKSKVIDLVKALLETDLNRLVITVPSKDFNVNFGITDPDWTRHPDHLWEPNWTEWSDLIMNIIKVSPGWGWKTDFICNKVNDVGLSIMTTFTRQGAV
jgi:hypothetical protein